ncbi:hypothetical protein [Vibrio algivorus]|uniref:hypothetical protein n=1 Tax=Vibrio algivorus TaxID=1667024 RepID=UPI001C9124E6|nr:hypothetical protein [Vibrio algivorus]
MRNVKPEHSNQKQKLDNGAAKTADFLEKTTDKLGCNNKPMKSNTTDNDSTPNYGQKLAYSCIS